MARLDIYPSPTGVIKNFRYRIVFGMVCTNVNIEAFINIREKSLEEKVFAVLSIANFVIIKYRFLFQPEGLNSITESYVISGKER